MDELGLNLEKQLQYRDSVRRLWFDKDTLPVVVITAHF